MDAEKGISLSRLVCCQRVPLIEDVMGLTDEEDYALE
jgi:hypothetical protein